MKFNKWTTALAAVGVVSMASAVRADEAPKLVPLNTALSSTTISGYVDVAAQYNLGNYGPAAGVPVGTAGTGSGDYAYGFTHNKVDAFSLNDVDIALDKPQDESPWAAGYHVELNYGADAVGVGINGSQAGDAAGNAVADVRQAYVVIRTPVGNGIDWKVGVQDDIIGYEGNTDGANPNYTRSYGYSVEPTTLLGLIGSYKITDAVTVQAGIADATSPTAPGSPSFSGVLAPTSSDKTFAGAVTFTAPDSFGFAKGATLSLATLQNIDKFGQDNYYAGVTLPTPVNILKVGGSFDLVDVKNAGVGNPHNNSGWVIGAYGSLQPTDKLSFNVRGEYYELPGGLINPYTGPVLHPPDGRGEEITATVSYNLWANVISRAEFRWDHANQGEAFANAHADANAFLLAANLIYTF